MKITEIIKYPGDNIVKKYFYIITTEKSSFPRIYFDHHKGI